MLLKFRCPDPFKTIEMINNHKEKYKQFKTWQQTPFEVAPMSDEERVCATCETEYRGNFCPRCGQSAKVESRMSAGKTLLLVIDVWGLGNRGMFRTLRDLILRPGYLICDYLKGKRSAYFPPFKLLFLLTTLSLLIGHGFNIFHENYKEEMNAVAMGENEVESSSAAFMGLVNWINNIVQFQNDYPAIFQLCYMAVGSYFLFIFFRKSEILGKITFSEFFIGLTYMVDMFILYMCIIRFFGFFGMNTIYWSWVPLLYLIPLKQMSGYSIGKTIFRSFCGVSLGLVALGIFMVLAILLAIVIFH